MRRIVPIFSLLLLASLFYRCGQPMPPMGGARDSLPPVLVKANPNDSAVNVQSGRLTLEFNEYVHLQGLQQQLVVTPVPQVQPLIESKLKVVTIKLKDSLQPNTTYSINFGNALQDINENNPLNNFTYVFSTGSHIDSGKISGRVLMAETGKADSTLMVVLHKNLSDTALSKVKPIYFARLDKEGFFTFRYLVPGTYNMYALRDQDGGLKFDSPSEMIGFLDSSVTVTGSSNPVKLYAYTEKDTAARPPYRPSLPKTPAAKDDKRLRYQSNLENGTVDILGNLHLNFEKPPVKFDTSKIRLTDETFNRIPDYSLRLDSTTVAVQTKWVPGAKYNLFIEKGLAEDSLGNQVIRTDTLKFDAKKETDYGSLNIRITNLDTSKNPVMMFFVGDVKKRSLRLTIQQAYYPIIAAGRI